MATMKRRIVYLSDEQWASLQEQAARGGTTISEFIRTGLAWVPKDVVLTSEPDVEFHVSKAHAIEGGTREVQKRFADTTRLHEDTVLQNGFRTRPFTPVPKKGK